MYGMVNEGIRTLVEAEHGPDAWDRICASAGVDTTSFQRMSSYDDDVTYRLVGAISEEIGQPPDKVLEAFGNYWITFAGASEYARLMSFSGGSLLQQLAGLDEMHERVSAFMPHLKPPSFELEMGDGPTHRLHYYSDRAGLAPMIAGLLQGMAQKTGERIEVAHVVKKDEGADHDEFDITILG